MIFKDILTTKNLVFIILLLILLKILPAVSDIVMLFFACFVLSCSLLPVVQLLDKKIKNRSLSAGIVISGAVILTQSNKLQTLFKQFLQKLQIYIHLSIIFRLTVNI